MDDEKSIILPREFKSKFLVRVKARMKDGTWSWLELSNRSEDFNEIVSQLNKIIKEWNLEISPLSFEVSVEEKPKEFVYVCPDCKTKIPAGDMQTEKLKLFCSNCKTWKEFERREK
jgi:hypothetical protein